LLSLEHYDPDTRRATKAAIFRERTVQPGRALPQVSTPQDALLVTLGERGRVDLGLLSPPHTPSVRDHHPPLLHRHGSSRHLPGDPRLRSIGSFGIKLIA
jgi:hypothetical protein